MHNIKHVLASVGDPVLVVLVTQLSGGSVPEHVIRSQAKRLRRELRLSHPGANDQAA